MDKLLAWHQQHHPVMEGQDIVKLIFQAKLGCGHLLGEEILVAKRIEAEQASLQPAPEEPLLEPLGPDYVRMNLRRAMADGIKPLWIARLMKLSASDKLPSRQAVADAVMQLGHQEASQAAQRLLDEPEWIPSHTPAYHAAYAPAYRVIGAAYIPALTILQQVAALSPKKDRLLLCIDGPCGSGKSTLAQALCRVLEAPVVQMDDFFLPHPLKTPERLAMPGGNADWERLVSEFLLPWLENGCGSYRRYNCHTDEMGELIPVPRSQVTIIEGSYSLLPEIGRHADLRIFLQISSEEQHRRILRRNGRHGLQMFIDRWIPLEQAYFKAFHLPDQDCLVLPQSQDW